VGADIVLEALSWNQCSGINRCFARLLTTANGPLRSRAYAYWRGNLSLGPSHLREYIANPLIWIFPGHLSAMPDFVS
jgi:hypothetical protein